MKIARSCATRSCRHWHNESTLNCAYPHLINECVSFTPTLVNVERELLCMLVDRQPWWPYDETVDRAYVHKLHELYGKEINLVDKFYLWEDYWFGKPAHTRTNPRLGFHRYCIRGVELNKKYRNLKTTPGNPGERGAGHAVPLKGTFGPDSAALAPQASPRPLSSGPHTPASGAVPDRVKRVIAEAAAQTTAAINPPTPRQTAQVAEDIKARTAPRELTQEELEARRRQNLEWAKGQGGKKSE